MPFSPCPRSAPDAAEASSRSGEGPWCAPRIRLPLAPVVVAGLRRAAWLSEEGEIDLLDFPQAAERIRARFPRPGSRRDPEPLAPPLLCHMPVTAKRLGLGRFLALDVLELFAFVFPARFCLPTPNGLAAALDLPAPPLRPGQEAEATTLLHQVTERLLALLVDRARQPLGSPKAESRSAPGIATAMAEAGWPWGGAVLAALGYEAGEGGGPDASEPAGESAAADPGASALPGRRAQKTALSVWLRLPEFSEEGVPPPPGSEPVAAQEAREHLATLLGAEAEQRPQQADFCAHAAQAFAPRDFPDQPQFVLAEAGTGIGKTLGYVAPASLWAERNQGAVWISTFTRNLQHQIDHELSRLFPDPAEKARRVVLRKGRENYLCLLNMEEAIQGAIGQMSGLINPDMIALGLMARWAERTRDGALTGGDFPGWLADLIGRGRSLGLADRRGECLFSACPHYSRCYIEHSVRRARRADIVVANHALVMIQAALGGLDEAYLPSRYVFDEGHHLFDAADSAFSAHLTGREAGELRRWLLGAEGGSGRSSRARGLRRRIEDLILGDVRAMELMDALTRDARCLPAEGWQERLDDVWRQITLDAYAPLDDGWDRGAPSVPGAGTDGLSVIEGTVGAPALPAAGDTPENTAEARLAALLERLPAAEGFLLRVRQQVYARAPRADSPYSIEVEPSPAVPGLVEAARRLEQALRELAQPLLGLAQHFERRLENEAADLDTPTRQRLESVAGSLRRRGLNGLEAWIGMLHRLSEGGLAGSGSSGGGGSSGSGTSTGSTGTGTGSRGATTEDGRFVDWLAVERQEGRDIDVGLHRHWIDPTEPFAEMVARPAHGVLVTSATLTDLPVTPPPGDGFRGPPEERQGAPDAPDGESAARAEALRWRSACYRTGAAHLATSPYQARFPSPFDYAATTRVLIIRDVRKDDMGQVAAAYRALFEAAGGGALGLFTAISRLKAVHARIAPALDLAGLPLLAQHIDGLDPATLVDIFRADREACLLGTDALRDGVDVPGESLRLIVFDRVPWPRPDILHRARRQAYPRDQGGAKGYDDLITRLRLKQAFGRLVRRAGDRGVFVLLDPMMPSRLSTAFPPGVPLMRTGLADAVIEIRRFFDTGVK